MKASFWRRYGDAIKFNRNIIVAGIGSFFSGALASQFYSDYDSENRLANSAVTLAAEYGVYIPAFALLFYIDNRRRYAVDPKTGRRNSKAISDDVKKLLAAFSISEVIYSAAKFGAQYQLLQSGMEAYQASMIASAVAWTVFLVAVNALAKATRLFGQKQSP